MTDQHVAYRRWPAPAAWLAFSAALLLLALLQLVYRFTLPTDGWAVYSEEINGRWIAYFNLVGAPSDLQPGDQLLALAGLPVVGDSIEYVPPPLSWRVGQTVPLLVARGSSQLVVDLPVVNWTPAAWWRYQMLQPSPLAGPLGLLVFLAVSWFTFWRRPRVPSAQALLVLSSAFAAAFISGLLPDGLSVQFDRLAVWTTGFFSYAIFGTLIAPAMFLFALLFPKPKRAIQRRPWLAGVPFIYGLLLLVYLLAGGAGVVGWISTLIMFAATIVSLLHAGFTQRDAVSRAQLRWAISSFILGLALFMLNFVLAFGLLTDPLLVGLLRAAANLSIVVIGLGLALAVMRYRLYDIDVIIRKTLVYAIISGLLAAVYFGSVISLQTLFTALTNERTPLALVISTLAIAALFNPLRRRVQAFVDRRFYRQKYDAAQTLARFAQTARDEVELPALTAEMVRVIRETVQPAVLYLWLPTRLDQDPASTDSLVKQDATRFTNVNS